MKPITVVIIVVIVGIVTAWDLVVGYKLGYRRGHDAATCEVVKALREKGLAGIEFSGRACP